MPEEYRISGTLRPADGDQRGGVKVQAFDRDLPSLERRAGSLPQFLGEAVTDDEGRFQITYTREQFSAGEAISSSVRIKEKNADISFRLFDKAEQELSVRRIETLNRSFGPNEIIFNVPALLEVTILTEPAPASESSEYEVLLGRVASILEDVPLTQLGDEDITFLINELGLEQQREDQQRLKWLCWSALLTDESAVPTPAFYGWARTGLPPLWNELPSLEDENRRGKVVARLLDELAATPEQQLIQNLQRAIDGRIIPPITNERATVLANSIRRRWKKEFKVRLRLEVTATAEPLTGYTVTTFDVDANNRDLGTGSTDSLGEFEVVFWANNDAVDAGRNLRFRVRRSDLAEPLETTVRIKLGASLPISIRVSIPGAQQTLLELRGDAGIDFPHDLLETLEAKHRIRSLADIRRIGGLRRIPELRAIDSDAIEQLDALADLDRLSSNRNETKALIEHKFYSVAAIAETPRTEFVALMKNEQAGFTERRATELHVAARAQTDILEQIFAGVAIDFANGIRPLSGIAASDYFPPFPEDQEHG